MRLIEHAIDPGGIAEAISSNNVILIKGFASRDLCTDALYEHNRIDLPILAEPVYQRGFSFRSVFNGGQPISYTRLYGGAASGKLGSLYHRMVALAQPIRLLLGGTDSLTESYHLEIFSYAEGVGFARHRHDKCPQMLGMVLLLSEANLGGTVFHDQESMLDLGKVMDQGDLAIFPWDMEHEVKPAVAHSRVVALLPFY